MRKETNLQQWVAVCKKYESLQPSQSVLEENKCSERYSKYRAGEHLFVQLLAFFWVAAESQRFVFSGTDQMIVTSLDMTCMSSC